MGLLLSCPLLAQNEIDALRYSQTNFGGTARSIAVGGAFGALGADFSSASFNPAGLGLYRGNEIMITPGFNVTNHRSDFLGNQAEEIHYNLNFSNFGFVHTNLLVDSRGNNMHDKWRAYSFAFGFNRLNNFQSRQFYSGFNAESSISNFYANELRGTHPSGINPGSVGFEPSLAYETFLVDPVSGDSTNYVSRIPNGMVEQNATIDERGGINEFTLSFAGNYDDRLYMGATIGFPRVNYTNELSFTERDVLDSIPGFRSLDVNRELQTQGWGINFKGGMAYRVANWLRLGAAVHSPTYFRLEDEYSSNMTNRLDSETITRESPDGNFSYNLTTPWRVIGSAAFIISKYGFLSVDYEFVDYSESFYSFGSGNQLTASQQNNNIRNLYGPASNLRVGAEGVIDNIRLRAGYAYYGSPFKDDVETAGGDQIQQFITGGIGFREESFYLDLGFARRMSNDFLGFYTMPDDSGVGSLNEVNRNQIVMTVGFRL